MKFRIVAKNKLGEFFSREKIVSSYAEIDEAKQQTEKSMANPGRLIIYGERCSFYIPPELAKETMLYIEEL